MAKTFILSRFLMSGVSVALLAAAIPASAAQAPVNARATAQLGALRKAGDPYKRLFEARTALPKAAAPASGVDRSKPRVVCGMTVVPVEPKTDPGMLLEPKGGGVDYKIRAIDPPICNPAR